MARLLEWKSSYSVGVDELDRQHMSLLRLINELAEGNPDRDAKQCFVALNDLIRYAQVHFNAEEELMGRHDFSGAAIQHEEHEGFVGKVFEMNQELAEGNLDIFTELVDFLKDWYISHVLGTDRDYVEFFKEKNVT